MANEEDDYAFALRLQRMLNGESCEGDADEKQQPALNEVRRSQDIPKAHESDYDLAVRLQKELNAEADPSSSDGDLVESSPKDVVNLTQALGDIARPKSPRPQMSAPSTKDKSSMTAHIDDDYLNHTQNLVHPEWELVDPTPDVFAMFVRFDQRFFQDRLGAVRVEWSKRMYSCAGICYQRGNRLIKDIVIRLSAPLLKLRPRKDLVETLLHEMIHAYCFVLNIQEGNGGHGPNFKRIMNTINKVAGTNITVYHTFHDEVNVYKTHIWRCNGICQHHNPFQGWVKRTCNRAPGPSDQWWEKHQRECGGTFVKMSEPSKPKPASKAESKKPNATKKEVNSNVADIRKFFGNDGGSASFKKPNNPNQPPKAGPISNAFPPTSYPGQSNDPFANVKPVAAGNLSNVIGFGDLNSDGERGASEQAANRGMTGQGYSLSNGDPKPLQDTVDRDHMREVWSKRFGNEKAKADKDHGDTEAARKRRRLTQDDAIPVWESYDDDVLVRDVKVPTICISDSESDGENEPSDPPGRQKMTSQERTMIIKREVMEDERLLYSDEDIFMIDDEFDDDADAEAETDANLSAASELADQSVINDIFGRDTLMEEFQRDNDVVPSGSRYQHDAANDITSCPICFESMKRSDFENHLEGCSITIRIPPPSVKPKAKKGTNVAKGRPKRNSVRKELQKYGYTDAEIAEANLSSSSTGSAQSGSEEIRIRCPFCGEEMPGSEVDLHARNCSNRRRRRRYR
ncbi:uncharacterized protein LOC115627506 [Scaptodrosophila lebanonensis]|uniref:Uncharacterized protein LOC115627506 n=1 Tax=Drosophila lebanonensis TaxID=7225 RepID=A0A6J2TSK8_DROLE|nr:uncharacterized protein LOC115627506 [Scaptodrosophila lebanonensis]XP_030379060.1 uncharacterized protein LOC115627506 [Scaptodrosophila lebanonensis]